MTNDILKLSRELIDFSSNTLINRLSVDTKSLVESVQVLISCQISMQAEDQLIVFRAIELSLMAIGKQSDQIASEFIWSLIDDPKSIRFQANALEALGYMKNFNDWDRLFPCIMRADSDAALLSALYAFEFAPQDEEFNDNYLPVLLNLLDHANELVRFFTSLILYKNQKALPKVLITLTSLSAENQSEIQNRISWAKHFGEL